ncbi:MAG: gliding motility lipoprotein GldH [Bacteroidales bacterium]
MKSKIILNCLYKRLFYYRIFQVTFLLIALNMLWSCHNTADMAEKRDIPHAVWDMAKPLRFEYHCNDTINYKDILFTLRHTGQYPYSNIFLFITTLAPNGHSQKDTVEFMLADTRGKWFGRGIGDVYSLQLIFKRNIRFGQTGRYIFYIYHGMREQKLQGITDLGMLIKNSEIKND